MSGWPTKVPPPKGAYAGHCPVHRKELYASRKQARHSARLMGGEGKRMRAYECDQVEGMWHLARLPQAVVAGRATSREVYRRG